MFLTLGLFFGIGLLHRMLFIGRERLKLVIDANFDKYYL